MSVRELWVVEEHLDIGGGEFGVKAWEPLSWLAYSTEKQAHGGMESWKRDRKRTGKVRVVRYAAVTSDD